MTSSPTQLDLNSTAFVVQDHRANTIAAYLVDSLEHLNQLVANVRSNGFLLFSGQYTNIDGRAVVTGELQPFTGSQVTVTKSQAARLAIQTAVEAIMEPTTALAEARDADEIIKDLYERIKECGEGGLAKTDVEKACAGVITTMPAFTNRMKWFIRDMPITIERFGNPPAYRFIPKAT